VQLVESDDRERQALQQLLELAGLRVEGFSSLAERAASSGECLLWCVDGPTPPLDELLRETSKGTSVVLVARALPLAVVVRAVKAGVVDVLCKPLDMEELRRAVEQALARTETERLHRARLLELRQRLERLTAREQEVFQRLIDGQLNKQVGAELGITERTVKAHRASILRKVAVGSIAELVRIATTVECGCQRLVERTAAAEKHSVGRSDETTKVPV
jgi:FixJ family two-component response regulator